VQLPNDRGQVAHTRLPRRRQSSLLYGVVKPGTFTFTDLFSYHWAQCPQSVMHSKCDARYMVYFQPQSTANAPCPIIISYRAEEAEWLAAYLQMVTHPNIDLAQYRITTLMWCIP